MVCEMSSPPILFVFAAETGERFSSHDSADSEQNNGAARIAFFRGFNNSTSNIAAHSTLSNQEFHRTVKS